MNRKYILILVGLGCVYAMVYTAWYKIHTEHGTPDKNNYESRIIIENNSTKHIEEGDSLIVEEISGGTIILVPYDQSNLIDK